MAAGAGGVGYGPAVLLRELVATAAMQIDLWRARRELAGLRAEFPPRIGKSPFWPALALLAAGMLLFAVQGRR